MGLSIGDGEATRAGRNRIVCAAKVLLFQSPCEDAQPRRARYPNKMSHLQPSCCRRLASLSRASAK